MFGQRCSKLTNSFILMLNKNIPAHKKFLVSSKIYSEHNRFLYLSGSKLVNSTNKFFYQQIKSCNNIRILKQFTTTPPPQYSELLEKLIAGLSSDIHQKNRVYKNDLMRVLAKVSELNFSSKRQQLLLLRCCTELLPDESTSSRMALAEKVWTTIKPHAELDVDHYNELLRVYIANQRTITARKFIGQMGVIKPNITTFELILRALGEAGDINQATEVISNMKTMEIPATEKIFNSLIICEGKAGNPKDTEEILSMMKSLKIEPSVDTVTAHVRSLIWNKMFTAAQEEMDLAVKKGLKFSEENITDIVKTLTSMGVYEPIPQVLKMLPKSTLENPSISPYLQSVTTQLVFQNHPMAALEIYKCLPLPSFGPKDDKGLHGRSLVRDCVKASMPSSVISLISQELMSTGRNPIAIQNAAEAALQLGKTPLALDLFTRMKQLGMPLRPHYFWPILLQYSKSFGEKGIMTVLHTMMKMEVKPDYETMKEYVLPYVSFNSPQNLMKKFMDTGLTVSSVLTPMMEFLLNSGQVRAASEICELFEGKVDAEKLLKPLLKGYLISNDIKSTMYALEDISKKAEDKSKDWVGRFLCVCMQNKKVLEDMSECATIIKGIANSKLAISTAAVDYCLLRIPEKQDKNLAKLIQDGLIQISNEKLLDDGDFFTSSMPHPKTMDEQGLKAHLIELEAKGMNTRGVLRKLLQLYCKQGNLKEAREIADKCQKEGVFLSAGMKAAIFDLQVKLGELEMAEMALADLNKTAPNFTLDEFKIVDFATLMAYRKKVDKAMSLISDEAKKRKIAGGRSIEMNCWRLLDATAAHGKIEDTRKMLELLLSLGYCKPTNVLLGPLIRAHLNANNLEEAVKEFVRLGQKYNKTPLKHELFCKILQSMSDGQSEDYFLAMEKVNGKMNKLAQSVLTMDKQVHGPGDVQLTVLSALADVGYTKTLRKMFLDPTVKFHGDALMRRCERFAQEKKVNALLNIAECAKDIRHIDVNIVYELILDVYQRDDKVRTALELWTKMQEMNISPTQKFVKNLCAMLKANNMDVPADLSVYLDNNKATKRTS